jgi:prepilin-type processing-associated H-X9-DG protein
VGVHHNYLSYVMPASLGGFTKKITEIKRPFEKYIFVEESDTRAYMVGGWSLGVEEIGRDGWWDGLAVWHNKSSTFGFGDGHAEKHKWVNESTLERANRDLTSGGSYGYQPYTSGPREDLDWLQGHWPSKK